MSCSLVIPIVTDQSPHGSLLPDHFDSHLMMQLNDPVATNQRSCSNVI